MGDQPKGRKLGQGFRTVAGASREGAPPWDTLNLHQPGAAWLILPAKTHTSAPLQGTHHPGAWEAWCSGRLRTLLPHVPQEAQPHRKPAGRCVLTSEQGLRQQAGQPLPPSLRGVRSRDQGSEPRPGPRSLRSSLSWAMQGRRGRAGPSRSPGLCWTEGLEMRG